MKPLTEIIHQIIQLRRQGRQVTLLAVCPNSSAVLEAAVKSAAENRSLMLFAATLNQVDRDGGYTGWTQAQFVDVMHSFARQYHWDGPLYPCLDHGGPWLKDRDTRAGYTFEQTFSEVKQSLTACLQAGYALLHLDTTVDRDLAAGQPPDIDVVVERAVELVAHVEAERARLGLPPIAYEAGSDEVHGGLVEFDRFQAFLGLFQQRLTDRGLGHIWPAFIVTQVGTDLHTTRFDDQVARQLFAEVSPMGSLIKGHYTDWVENPEMYPQTGMGGANVGPEFTAEEFHALQELCEREATLTKQPSNLMQVIEGAVYDSGRWRKWLQPGEENADFYALNPERRTWLAETGARYIWTSPSVLRAREVLYRNLESALPNPHEIVVERIQKAIDKYIQAFNLVNSVDLFV